MALRTASARLSAPLRQAGSQQRGIVTLVRKYMKSLEEFGFQGTIQKLYSNGDVKFGKLMGTDKYGNEYYENAYDYPYGQHRWVENHKELHDFCPSMIPPEWHSWLHSTTDHLPTSDKAWEYNYIKANEGANSDVLYADNHVGGVEVEHRPNESGYKDRAYGFGSRYSEVGQEKQYLQPGHVLNRYGRSDKYEPHRQSMEEWTPAGEESAQEPKKRLRSLQED